MTGDAETPLASGEGGWALLNLILTVLTVLGSIIIIALGAKKKEDEEENNRAEAENDEDKENAKRKLIMKISGILIAIGAVILFIVTEDMTQPMVFVDKWTIITAVVTLVQTVVAVFTKKDNEDDEKEEAKA